MSTTGPKIQLQPMIIAVISAAMGALATWALKIEDRVFVLATKAVTQQDITDIESRCNNSNIRLERLVDQLTRKLERLDSDLHNERNRTK